MKGVIEMTDITLIRHSRSTDNDAGIFGSCRRDAHLSEQGKQLARESAEATETCPDAIYTSDLHRAYETAAIYADVFKKKFGKDIPIITLKSLRSQDCGDLEGIRYDSELFKSLEAAPGGFIGAEIGDYGGEKKQDAIQRQEASFLGVAFSAAAKNYKNVFVVTHTDTIDRFMQVMETGFDWKTLRNCQHLGPFSNHDISKKLLPRQAEYVTQRTGKKPRFIT